MAENSVQASKMLESKWAHRDYQLGPACDEGIIAEILKL